MHAPQTASRGIRRWTPALLALAVAGSLGLLVVVASCGAVTARLGAAPTATLTKVQLGNAMMATQQALAREDGPKKTVTAQQPVTNASTSCPIGSIPNHITMSDGTIHQDIINVAIIGPTASVPYLYNIYAGALAANTQQGIMVVMTTPEDPCKNPGGTETTYQTPYQKGALMITEINATSVSFSIADGGMGQFNFVTNQFS